MTDLLDDLFGTPTSKKGAAKTVAPSNPPAPAPPPAPIRAKREDRLYDAECGGATRANPNMLIPWFLMAQYLYYYRDCIIISDGTFDYVSREMVRKWANLTHVHKPAAALYVEQGRPQLLVHEYPSMARGAACRLAAIPYLAEGKATVRGSIPETSMNEKDEV